jgi:hypothetical protein
MTEHNETKQNYTNITTFKIMTISIKALSIATHYYTISV